MSREKKPTSSDGKKKPYHFGQRSQVVERTMCKSNVVGLEDNTLFDVRAMSIPSDQVYEKKQGLKTGHASCQANSIGSDDMGNCHESQEKE